MKIPDELFVALKNSKSGSIHDGSLIPYDVYTKAGKKRYDNFIYNLSSITGFRNLKLENDLWVYSTQKWNDQWRKYHITNHILDRELWPRVWKNEKLTGFKIINFFITGVGNKKWAIEDPRGAVFDITTRSLAGIIKNSVIDKGEILEPCVWANAENLVVAT